MILTRRIGIKESVGTVIVADQRLEVLVLDHHICHAVFQLLNQPEQLSDVKGLGGEGLSAAGVAVAEKLQEHGRSAHIVIFCNA